jgi:uncharacterized protein YutE (UPF0331/DUF86 family)
MAEFTYAKGRISESVQFISREIEEFQKEYAQKTWKDYQEDTKLQKLMDRTVENILTALIEVCGTVLAERGMAAENYSEVLKETAKLLGFSSSEQENLAKLAIQRNRLVHRYFDFRWQAIKMYQEQQELIITLLERILSLEGGEGK